MSQITEEKCQKLVEKIKKQVALEERAFRVVEQLVELTPSEELLREMLCLITCDQYSDITEERAITKLCGYPLCSNHLSEVPKQKYHISVRSKTVYDITERKNFCCNECYKASKYLQNQIPTSPIWLREDEPPVTINFLPKEENRGSAGEIIVTRCKTDLMEEIEALEKLDALDLNLRKSERARVGVDSGQQLQQNHSGGVVSAPCSHSDSNLKTRATLPENIDSLKTHMPPPENTDGFKTSILPPSENTDSLKTHTAPPSENTDCLKTPIPPPSENADNLRIHKLMNMLTHKSKGLFKNCVIDVGSAASSAESTKEIAVHHEKRFNTKVKSDSKISKVMSAMETNAILSTDGQMKLVTSSSASSLLEKVKVTLLEWRTPRTLSRIDPSFTCAPSPSQSNITGTNFSDSRLLMLDQLLDSDEEDEGKVPTKKLPDIEKLKQDSKEFELKVKDFYGKKVEFAETGVQDQDIVLPCVHSHSQIALRRKIVLDKLGPILQELIEHSHLRIRDVSTSVHDLVHTFALTSQNILLKSSEWNVIGYILLKIIARRDERIQEALLSDTVTNFVRHLLSKLSLTNNDIDDIVLEFFSVNNVQPADEHGSANLQPSAADGALD